MNAAEKKALTNLVQDARLDMGASDNEVPSLAEILKQAKGVDYQNERGSTESYMDALVALKDMLLVKVGDYALPSVSVHEAVTQAQQDELADVLDSWMSRIATLHDVSKALPHPYNAIDDMAVSLMHDYAGIAYRTKMVMANMQMTIDNLKREARS